MGGLEVIGGTSARGAQELPRAARRGHGGRSRRCFCGALAGALALVLLGAPARATPGPDPPDRECEALDGDSPALAGRLLDDPSGWSAAALPESPDVDRALADLDATDEPPLVFPIDLDGDGARELLVTSPGGRLCGNAGCPFVVLAGEPPRKIGELFGHPAVLDERVNHHRVLQSYSRVGVEATRLETYTFDAGRYRLVSRAVVDRCGLGLWSRSMRKGTGKDD